MGHGATNSTTLAGLAPEQERDTIRAVLKTIEQATGNATIAHMKERQGVWFATGSEIIDAYQSSV
jgi:hypothetical protein